MTQHTFHPNDCEGKASYQTKADALRSIRERQSRARRACYHHKERKRSLATLSAYRCDICANWHVGGNYSPKRPRK